MKDRKTRINLFAFYDKTGLERYLERQSAAGWMVDSVSSLTIRFHRMEKPTPYRFEVAFFAGTSFFDSDPTEDQLRFEDRRMETGWKIVTQNRPMSIYYNTDPDAEPVETDPASQVRSINEVAQHGALMGYYLLLMLSMFWLAVTIRSYFHNPLEELLSNSRLVSFLIFIFIWVAIIWGLGRYHHWHKQAMKLAETEQRFLEPKSFSKASVRLFMVVCIALVVLQFLPFRFPSKPVSTYEHNGVTYSVYDDKLPLSVGDILHMDCPEYSSQILTDSSLLLKRVEADHSPRIYQNYLPGLHYTVVYVKLPFLYNTVKRSLLDDLKNLFDDDLPKDCILVDAAPWGAKEAYRLSYDGELKARYVLCYKHAIVSVAFFGSDWTYSPEETAVFGETFGK